MYTTLLMSTGLTFGTISALYGLTHGIVSREQYTVLVAVVVLSACVPTLLAQHFYRPRLEDHREPAAGLAAEAVPEIAPR
jgi:Kef-type K+ transport system membrane component KefB